jgi:hypothetical protein
MSEQGVSWAEYAAAMPDMAAAGLRLLMQYGVGLGYLATVRADGGPRVHPTCPHVVDGEFWVYVTPDSPKRADLDRDGRYAFHACGADDRDDEFYLTGRATRVDDAATRDRIAAGFKSRVDPSEVLYRLNLETALLSLYRPRAEGWYPPQKFVWKVPG